MPLSASAPPGVTPGFKLKVRRRGPPHPRGVPRGKRACPFAQGGAAGRAKADLAKAAAG